MSKSAPVPDHPLGNCFWELNRRCEFLCLHCRAESSPAGDEGLPLEAALEIADQVVALGVPHMTLTGGEPMLYPGWDRIARRLADGGVRVRLFTSGVALDTSAISQALANGVAEFAIPLDGPREIHDALRPPAVADVGSGFDAACSAIHALIGFGVPTWVVTQVNGKNVEHLEATYELLLELEVKRWTVHLCQATGRARAARAELLLDPIDLEAIVGVLMRTAREGQITAPLTCSIGYLTEEDLMLRGRGGRRPLWKGCGAGLGTFGITSRGDVKGCAILPDEFVTGSLTERSLQDLWQDEASFPYTRQWTPAMLAGDCARCGLAERCRGGCPAVAYGATGAFGANPYCLRLVRRTNVQKV